MTISSRAYQDVRPPDLRDELLHRDGTPRRASRDLAATVDVLGLHGLLARRAELARLVADEGVTYGSGEPGAVGPWRVDPLPVILEAAEWSALADGVRQRAELLDRLLADLSGPRTLLRRGVVPPEVVLAHSGFVRPADAVGPPARRELVLAACDLARSGTGEWVVLGDRTQAPSGAGYAMQTRRLVSRVMAGLYRDTALERLRTFFHTVRAGLMEAAPATAEAPRVVLLTPGPGSETAFDQSFLSTLLGYPLVEGEDLTVREWSCARTRASASPGCWRPCAAGPSAVRSFLLPSPLVAFGPAVQAWACEVFTPGRPVGHAVTALVHRIHEEFTYHSGVTSVRTTLPEVLDRRAGVCQDFAHLAVGALRWAGLPARYVSGYLETRPPPGRSRLQGVDASHAWASVLLPELGWVDLDPTNDQLVDERYVVTAWGRDYSDVPPLQGVIFTEGEGSSLTVEVDVLRHPTSP